MAGESKKKQATVDERSNGFQKVPLPPDLERPIPLSENARTVLRKRYLRRGPDGQPVETEQEMFWRVAYHVARAEAEHGGEVEPMARRFYDLLTTLRFFPNSPTFTGAGTPLGQLAACFVLPIDDDMGRTGSGIFETLRHAALIQQTGGGNGFSFSRLRPKGALVRSSSGAATGPVGFLRVYDQAFGEIAQGGCLVPETLVFTAEGALYLGEVVTHRERGWQAHRLTVATDEGQRESRQAYCNGVAPVLRVLTEEGLDLTGTPDHKVKVMTAQGPAWQRLDELQPGDAVLVKLGQHQGRLQVLKRPARRHGNQVMPDLPAVLDEEFAFFLGYLAGDGFVASGEHDHRVGVTVAHSSYLFAEMPALIKRLFGEQIQIHRQQKAEDASVTFWVDNRAIKDFLILNGLDKSSSTRAFVPRLIRQSSPEVVGAYLRGLFEADGTISHGYPLLMSSSETLIREVAVLLIGLGCPVRISRQPQSADRYGSAPLFALRIHSFVGLKAWRERIGCDPASRFAACQEFVPDLTRETTYPLPHASYWVEPVLEAITLPQVDARGRGTGKKLRASDPWLRKQLLRYTRGERQLTFSGYELLKSQSEDFAAHARPVDDLWFVTVKAVEPAGEALTLDIEVDDNHTYLAGGWVTHNSRRGANMAVLRVDHPDIREFITCKTDENAITNFNISVGITDAFMRAVEEDADFDLVNPQDGSVWETVRARELFDLIVRQAHHNGEPGVLFLDTANRQNPVPHLYELESTNPCFVGDTRIATEQGLLTIAELAELGWPLFVATDNRAPTEDTQKPAERAYGVALRPATPAFLTRRNTPVLRLTTRMGYSVTATPDHRFLTPNGYVALQDLRPGDVVLIQSGEGAWSRNYELPNAVSLREEIRSLALSGNDHTVQRRDFAEQYENVPERWSHDLGLVMGWLVGDGWVSDGKVRKSIGFAFADEESLAQIHEPLSEWFGPGSVVNRGSVKQLTYGYVPYRFFQTLGVSTKRAHEKRLPESLWTAPREAVVGFLQGLFGADGTVGVNAAKQDCTVRLASSSYGLLQDVQVLLSNFGILSRIYERRPHAQRHMPDGKGGQKPYDTQPQYELVIGKANRDRFAELIGFAHPGKQAKLEAFISAKKRRSNVETFTDKVASVEPAGIADVYDLAQPQTSSLIANGLVAHNCGEQFLGPFENCCLGSINLAQHLTPDDRLDWDKLAESVELSTRFLDDVVTANAYVPAVPQLKEAALKVRRIGLGIMGLADVMYVLGVRYGGEDGQEFASQLMEFVRYHAMRTSIALARERGPFPAIKGSIYDPDNLLWQPPQPLVPYKRDWGRPPLDWSQIIEGIRQHGIRNGAQLTIAPTGTISTVAGIEGYGCEPVFALAYTRYVNDNGKQITLQYTSPLFERALRRAGLDDAQIAAIVEQVNLSGTCQDVPGVPEEIRRVFVVSGDVTAEEHVRMQAALQVFVDNAISKCVTGDTLVLTTQGLAPIAALSSLRLPDQFAPLNLDVVTPVGVERADSFYYGGMRETRRVTLSYGYQIEGTPNHRVHVLGEDGAIRFAALDDLRVGDTVVLYSGQEVFGPAGQPLPPYQVERRTNTKMLRFPERMSPELAYVLGCITSEGSIGRNGVAICNGDRALLEHLAELFERLFGLNSYICPDKRRESVFSLQVNSRPLRDWLLNALHLQAGARNKIIPPCILRASRHEIVAFLRGLFLDAYMIENGRMFGIGLASQTLLRQLQVLLLNFGVFSRLQRTAEHAWVLTVAGEALERLAAFVEFDEWWKTERVQLRHEGRQRHVYNYGTLLPRPVTAALREMQVASARSVRSLFGAERVSEYQRARVNLLAGHRLDRQTAKALWQHLDDVSHPYAETFFANDREGLLYVQVEAVETGFAEVFDISVPGSHSFVANGLGNHNTINFPPEATEEDVRLAYQLGWKLGCKGMTVYVTGSREKVVLETAKTRQMKEGSAPPAAQILLFNEEKKPRPRFLEGKTYRVETPLGATYVTVNENGEGKGQPFEVFIHTAKAGSDTAAVSEALGRLISYILRLVSPVPPRNRLREVVRQLAGIGGVRAIGFGPYRVSSLPDGISQVLQEYLTESEEASAEGDRTEKPAVPPGQLPLQLGEKPQGDLCPECGAATLVNEEGCRKCYSCGFSEC